MLLLLHAIIPCLHMCMNCNSSLCMHNFHVVSFPHIHKLCIWSDHNQLFTVHHSRHYNLVSLIFGTTIPTSFNILMKCFLHFNNLLRVGTFLSEK